jgi:hypothetical protein
MFRSRYVWQVCALAGIALFVILGSRPSYGQNQEVAATLNGTVMDSTGLPINGAKVTLTSTQNGITRTPHRAVAYSLSPCCPRLSTPSRST